MAFSTFVGIVALLATLQTRGRQRNEAINDIDYMFQLFPVARKKTNPLFLKEIGLGMFSLLYFQLYVL